MKILILANKMPYPSNDGGTIATLTLARALANLGNKITLLAMNTGKHNYNTDDIPQEIKNEIEFHSVFVDTSIKPPEVLSNLIFSRVPYNAKRFISGSFKQKLVSLLRNQSFDLVQLEGLYLYPYINTIRKHFSGKISFRAHNIEHEIWRRSLKNQRQGMKRMYMRILTKRLEKFEVHSMNKFDLLVPITERDGHILEFLGNNSPMCTIPVGIDKNNYEYNGFTGGNNDLAFIGSLDWMPNQEGLEWFLSKVWPSISEKFENVKFHIAGRNAPPKFKYKLHQKNVVFHGEVEDALKYLNQYSFMIVPLLSGSGMRVKIIEGMALGRVIVTSSIGAEGINAQNGKQIIINDDPDEMIQSITNILSNPEKAKNISESARKFIEEKFDNQKIAQRLVDFYEQHLSKPSK